MKLHGIKFGMVLGASGVQGFFGEGYPYHRLCRMVFGRRFSFDGMTFVAKTTTFQAQEGNMPRRDDDITPREYMPKCIHLSLRSWTRGAALNAVGLSGPGAKSLLDMGRWQSRTDNFFLSFMPVAKTRQARCEETSGFVELLREYRKSFLGNVGLQINRSCPNVGMHMEDEEDFIDETYEMLDTASVLDIPLVPKINLLTRPVVAYAIARHRFCDAICVSNTLPWGVLPDKIDWEGIFGCKESPLKKLGGGGLSGAPLFRLLIDWLNDAHRNGFLPKPIIAGGGILGARDVRKLALCSGVHAVSIGSITMLRPNRLAEVISEARQCIF